MTSPRKYELSQSAAMAHYDITKPTIIQWRKQGIVKAKRRGKHWFYVREPIHVVEKRRASSVKGARSTAGRRAKRVATQMAGIARALDVAEELLHPLISDRTPHFETELRAAESAPRLVLALFDARQQVGDARLRLERARNLISPRAFDELESRVTVFERSLDLEEKRVISFLRQLALQIHERSFEAIVARFKEKLGDATRASETTSPVDSVESKKKEKA